MTLLSHHLFLLLPFLFTTEVSTAKVVAPVIKDGKTNLYTTTLTMRNPPVLLHLTLDLGIVRYLWTTCNQTSYHSSSYRPVACGSPQCTLSGSTDCRRCDDEPIVDRPLCHSTTCSLTVENPVPFSPVDTFGEASEDRLAISHSVVDPFLFACAPEFLVWQLPVASTGFAALGRSTLALPIQLSSKLNIAPIMALCLPSKRGAGAKGVIFFGGGPYSTKMDIPLSYTTLISNPKSMTFNPKPGEPSYEYFVQLLSIRVNNKPVPINSTLLNLDRNTGNYGTKLTTTRTLTRLEMSIYDAVTSAYAKEAAAVGIIRAKSDGSSRVCFSTASIKSTVPMIEFVFASAERGSVREVVWKFPAGNTLVSRKRNKEACLAFESGGSISPEISIRPETAVVIGGNMLEESLIVFDLSRSAMGFSSSLLLRKSSCSNLATVG